VQDSWSFEHRLAETGAAAPASLDALASKAAHGDRSAFEQIYCILADELYGYIRAQCRDADAAEDIVANVFLKAWRSARAYRSGSDRFRHWIFAIARNELRDYWRTLPRTVSLLDLDFEDPVDDQGSDRLEAARREVGLALAAVTPEQRQVVVLRYFGGKTYQEIAAIMDKREGAVRALNLRALRHMRKVVHDASP
jgi:RNA polymerase sigma-70 factor, ECF subfamily